MHMCYQHSHKKLKNKKTKREANVLYKDCQRYINKKKAFYYYHESPMHLEGCLNGPRFVV